MLNGLRNVKEVIIVYKDFLSVDSGDGCINDIDVTQANKSEVNEFDDITKNVNV